MPAYFGGFDSVATEAKSLIAKARGETLLAVLAALETGDRIGEAMAGAVTADTTGHRLRTIRDDLIELDVYRLLYGPLDVDAGTWRPPQRAKPVVPTAPAEVTDA